MKVMRVILAAAAATLLFASSASAASPLGTYPNCVAPGAQLGTQAWDITDGTTGGGEKHIHSQVCFPIFQTLDHPVAIDIQSIYHNIAGEKARHIRWSDGSNVKQTIDPNVTIPTNAYSRVDTFTLDPAKFDYSGWREVRISTMVDGPKGRWYTTTRWPVFVVNGKARQDYAWNGSSSSHGRCGTAGWYGQYMNVWVDCAQLRSALAGTPMSALTVRMENERGVLTLDADFHNGSLGNVQYDGSGANTWRTVALHAASGRHAAHLRTEHVRTSAPVGRFAGAFTFPVYTP